MSDWNSQVRARLNMEDNAKTKVWVEIKKARIQIDLHHLMAYSPDNYAQLIEDAKPLPPNPLQTGIQPIDDKKPQITAEQYAKLPIEEKPYWQLVDIEEAVNQTIQNGGFVSIEDYDLDSYAENISNNITQIKPEYLIGKEVLYFKDSPDAENHNTLEAAIQQSIVLAFDDRVTIVAYSELNTWKDGVFFATTKEGNVVSFGKEQIAAVYHNRVMVSMRNLCDVADDADDTELEQFSDE